MRFKTILFPGILALSLMAGAGSVFAATSYTVTNSDTMWKIAANHGISLNALIQANPQVANPDVIWPGMSLSIPSNGSTVASSPSPSSFADQVIELVNQERAKAGLQPLTSDHDLTVMALDKATDMYDRNYFDHTSPTYGSPFDMMNAYGISYSYAGENIAKGQTTPQEVMTDWMNSPGHRQNILSPNYTKIGAAYYNGEWVQEFIAD